MSVRYALLSALILGLSPALSVSAAGLDLKQAERVAIEHNLDLQAQVFDARASEAVVRREYGLYDPLLAADLAEGETRDPFTNITVVGSGPGGAITSADLFGAQLFDYRRFDFSLTQAIPTGASLVLSFDNMRQGSLADRKPLVDPVYESELRLSLVQPLLKGFGRTVTEQSILFAVKDREISLQQLRQQAFDTVSQVRDAWYEVLRLRSDMSYREASVALAQKVLEENRRRVEVGVLPPVDILEAEVGVKARERELLDAQRAYQDALDSLALLLDAIGSVEVADEAMGQPQLETDEEAGLRTALERRPDLLRQLKGIDRLGLEKKIARNRTLPQLDLEGSYSHKGIGKEYSDDLDRVGDDDLRNWEVGVRFSYPLGNREARNDIRRTELRLKAEQARLAQLRETVRQEIRAAIRLLEVSGKKIEAAASGRDLAEERLRTLLKRKEVGLATTRDVLQGEEDLALAQTDHSSALADYNRAVTGYLTVTGQLLEHEGIRFAGPVDSEEEGPLLVIGQ